MTYSTYSSDYDAFYGGLFFVFLIITLALVVLGYVVNALIYYYTAKTNGLGEVSFWAWIPLVNVYLLFAFGSSKTTMQEIKKESLMFLLIYIGLAIVSIIPLIGILASIAMIVLGLYYMYRLFYRWTGETGMSILFIILTIITGSLFYYIYGLIKMKKPFVA
ncbi:hypothetical protein [Ureibacillus sinduriensis]|uniref:Membrane protein n=1 Tax=Ureibacillus sinduriensis BLB-1 = JCM 15800 TaxID=1384057 RepID=A0A0A3HZ34_9BACL|nr:hypothetical protein [Ureibacillus sinduriensis]KGR76530.1 membrane protein [Ureibacillus sinduriensis BLB-1 = JCM 15800]